MGSEPIEFSIHPASSEMINPQFHDGLFQGVLVDEKKAILTLQTIDAARYEVELVGLLRMCLDEFWEGNIVHGLDILPVRAIDHAQLEKIFHAVGDRNQAAYLSKVREAALVGVLIECSYGASFYGLCERVFVRRIAD